MRNSLILIILVFLCLTALSVPVYETSEDVIEHKEIKRDLRWIPSISLGSLQLTSDKVDSDVNKNLEPELSAEIQLLWETPLQNPQMSFEWGLNFLGLGSKLKGHADSKLALNYMAIPLGLRFNLQNQSKNTQLFIRTTVMPAVLTNAEVRSCTISTIGCGYDDDWDDIFVESRSVKSEFNEYQTFASIGLGFESQLFKNFIVDSMAVIGDVHYTRTLGKVNRSEIFGQDMLISGFGARLGLALDF